jgi:hypothetical protein
MHTPIVVFATWASGSICHHWQSLHIPQSDAAIATAPLANRTPKNATSGRGEAVFGSERFFPATQSLPPLGNLPLSRSLSNIHTTSYR